MEYQRFIMGNLFTNCYLVWSDRTAGVIDPGGPVTELIRLIRERGLSLQWIVNTHGHADHIMGNAELRREFGAPLLIHAADRPMLSSPDANLSSMLGDGFVSPDADRTLKHGDRLALGGEQLTVLETPGHTPGGISLVAPGLVFSGDALFLESIGRTDFPGGDRRQLVNSIRTHLLTLLPETVVLPGHDAPTTIGYEARFNPYLAATDEV